MSAQFKNGENFNGFNQGFFERRSHRFEYALGDQIVSLSPRMGDLPALEMQAPDDGLMVVIHETAPQSLTYESWDKFQQFADHKGFADIQARHAARGLPESGFDESYTRHAKALIGIGSAQGADRPVGLKTEFVALTNPYTDDLSNGVAVQLFDGGLPRTDAQVEVFERSPDGTVSVSIRRTDGEGRTRIPVRAGHEYLLDAVILRASPAEADDVWQTLWAALTFRVP